MKIAVVTDSTANLPEALVRENDIHILHLSVIFGDKAYQEGIDITSENFYEKIKKGKKLPTTSQPAIGIFVDLYEKLAKDYDAVISIHISSKLSGTFDAAKTASSMVRDIEIIAYDSEHTALPQGFYVLEAAKLAKEQKSVAEIVHRLDVMKTETKAFFMVDDLKHLQRGGRLSGTQALLGGLLNIKPILHVVDGAVVPFEKIRTRKKAMQKILNLLEADIRNKTVKRAIFMHGNSESYIKKLFDKFQKKHPNIESMISEFGPVVATHLGEGSLGILWHVE